MSTKRSFESGLENPTEMARAANKSLLMRVAWTAVALSGITKIKWHRTVREYIMSDEVEQSRTKRTDTRSNITSAMGDLTKNITWNMLIKFFKAAGYYKCSVKFTLHHCDSDKPLEFGIQVYDRSAKATKRGHGRVKARNNNTPKSE